MTPLIKPIDLSIGNVKFVGPLSIAMVTTSPAATIVSYVSSLGVQGVPPAFLASPLVRMAFSREGN